MVESNVLNRDFTTFKVDEKWVTDITYFIMEKLERKHIYQH